MKKTRTICLPQQQCSTLSGLVHLNSMGVSFCRRVLYDGKLTRPFLLLESLSSASVVAVFGSKTACFAVSPPRPPLCPATTSQRQGRHMNAAPANECRTRDRMPSAKHTYFPPPSSRSKLTSRKTNLGHGINRVFRRQTTFSAFSGANAPESRPSLGGTGYAPSGSRK